MQIDKAKVLDEVKKRIRVTDGSLNDILNSMIDDVLDIAVSLRFPYDHNKTDEDLEIRYQGWVIRACKSSYDSIGYHNIKAYSENGYSISFNDIKNGIPQATLDEIVPFLGTLSNDTDNQ